MTFMQGLHGLNVTDHTYSRENITRDAGVIGGAFTLVRNSPELTAMLADRSRVIFRALPDETLEIDPAAFVRARALAAPQAAFIHLTNEIHPTAALNDWTIKALDAANALGVKVCALNLATHKNAAEWAVVRPAIEKAAAEGHAIGVHVYLDGVTDAGAWDWLPLMREVGGLWVCTEFGYIRRIQEPHRGWRGRMTETELGVWAEINAQPLVEANVPILWFAWDHWGAEKEERETGFGFNDAPKFMQRLGALNVAARWEDRLNAAVLTGRILVNGNGKLNVRTQPKISASIVTTLASGTVVKYTEQRRLDEDQREWYRLIEPDGYAAAWVSTIEPVDVVEDELRRLLDMQKALTASSQTIEGRLKALIDGK